MNKDSFAVYWKAPLPLKGVEHPGDNLLNKYFLPYVLNLDNQRYLEFLSKLLRRSILHISDLDHMSQEEWLTISKAQDTCKLAIRRHRNLPLVREALSKKLDWP